jgi:hypothetical protein
MRVPFVAVLLPRKCSSDISAAPASIAAISPRICLFDEELSLKWESQFSRYGARHYFVQKPDVFERYPKQR